MFGAKMSIFEITDESFLEENWAFMKRKSIGKAILFSFLSLL